MKLSIAAAVLLTLCLAAVPLVAQTDLYEGTASSGAGSTPEPSTLVLFGSGIVGLAGLLRHKLF